MSMENKSFLALLIIASLSATLFVVSMCFSAMDNFTVNIGQEKMTVELTAENFDKWREMGRELALQQLREAE